MPREFRIDGDNAYWLGVRDARLGHASSHPIHPYTSDELRAYRTGYSDQRATMATAERFEPSAKTED